jgi:hypothetical protein
VKQRTRGIIPLLGSAIALAGLTALPALAAEAPEGESAQQKARARAEATEAKLTEAQKKAVAAFRAQFDRDQGRVQSAVLPGQRLSRGLAGDRTLQVAVAKRNPDGSLAVICVDDAAQFAEFLAAEAKAPATPAEKAE